MVNDESRTAFEQLKRYYDQKELLCPECGYEDDEGAWESETDGRVVEYFHECPSCGAVREHTIELNGE